MLIQLLAILCLAYLGLCAVLFLAQRSLLYFPTPARNRHGAETFVLPGNSERVLVSTHPSAGPQALLYFGGNAEEVSFTLPELRDTFPGQALFLLHYRGYGGSTGSPSEAALFADALALYGHVHVTHPRITLLGRSLGSGLAVRIASQRPVERLVLITPYDSVSDIAGQAFPFLPVRWLLRDKYESWRYAPRVTAPTLILAAEHDEVIPRASTERLRTRFVHPNVRYEIVAGTTHNNISNHPAYDALLRGAR